MNLGDMGLPLTRRISGDDYVRTVLTARVEAWLKAHPASRKLGLPPLLEWFVQPEDERFVELPDNA